MNLRADALLRNQKAQEWSLSIVQDDGTTSGRSVCEQSNVQSRQVLQHGSDGQESNQQRWGQGEMATRTPICLSATTHDPTDARAVEANGRRTDTDHPILASQCWFPEIMWMAVIPPRRFKPHKWLLTNATTGEVIPKVMESIKLTAWKLSTGYAGEKGYQMKPRNESLVDGARVPRQDTDQHGTTGVLSTVKKDYQSFKFG